MRSTQPPRAATWLLRHLGCSPQNEAVIGDLVEQYEQGRSSGWYWWQVAFAIAAGFTTEVRRNKLFILRGLLLGTVFQVGFSYVMRLMHHSVRPTRVWDHPYLFITADVFILFTACAISGGVIARLYRRHGRAVVLAFVALQFLTMSIPSRVPHLESWIVAFGGVINGLIFQVGNDPHSLLSNTSVMPLLNTICDICASGVGSRILHRIVSALLAVTALLVGGGLLTEGSNGNVEHKHVPV